jgi:hypothetical protein
MRRSLTSLMLVAGLLVACGGQATTPPQGGAPASAARAASAPASSLLAPTTPTLTATPAPPPTVKQLAAGYLKVATAYNKANDKAWATWKKSAQTLTYAKRLARAYAGADLAFIRAVQKIPWYGDYKTLARRVLTYANQEYVSARLATISKTWADWNDNLDAADKASLKASAAANELRIALGLPPVPIK